MNDSQGLTQEQAVAANLASLNEIITEMIRAMESRGWTDPEFAMMVHDTLRGHSWSLGYRFQDQPPPDVVEVHQFMRAEPPAGSRP